MLLRVTIQPTNQPAYTLEFFDSDLARDMMRLIASGAVSVNADAHVPAMAAQGPIASPAQSPGVASEVFSTEDGTADEPTDLEGLAGDAPAYEEAAAYCRRVNPLGDMRRVVVATYAAELYMGAEGVSATELAGIFDATGWPQPTDFVQAIRNAAREKFGWLERVGNPGYYKVTATGRAAVLGEATVDQPTTAPLPLEPSQTNGIYEPSTA